MFDMTTDEMREDLTSLHGSSVYNWSDEDVKEEWTELRAGGIAITEGDFSNIDSIDDDFNERFGYKNEAGGNLW
jgi:hypothetical protein